MSKPPLQVLQVSKKITWVKSMSLWRFTWRDQFGGRHAVSRKNKEDCEQQHKLKGEEVIRFKAGDTVVSTKLSQKEVRCAERAMNALRTAKYDLEEGEALERAVNYFLKHYRPSDAPLFRDAVEQFLITKENQSLSEFTLRDYRRILGNFALPVENSDLKKITALQIEKYINLGKSDSDRRNRYSYLNAFFEYCTGKHNLADTPWLKANPLKKIKKTPLSIKEIASLDYESCLNVLKRGVELGLFGYLSFRLFTCLRREEAQRFLDRGELWENDLVRWNSKTIHIPDSVAKRKGRDILFNDSLEIWLCYLKQNKISIKPSSKKLRKIDELKPKNILRHTAITMHIRNFGSMVESARFAGTSESIVRSNYANLDITESDGKRFYELKPELFLDNQ